MKNKRKLGVTVLHYDKDVMNRLRRLEGQVRGVIKMMEDQKDCRDVVTQLSAVRSATDRTIGLVVAKNLEGCIIESSQKGTSAENAIQEAVNMLVKSR